MGYIWYTVYAYFQVLSLGISFYPQFRQPMWDTRVLAFTLVNYSKLDVSTPSPLRALFLRRYIVQLIAQSKKAPLSNPFKY